MRLENAVYVLDEYHDSVLDVFVNGEPARIHYGQKFLYKDIVFLGGGWEKRVDPIHLPEDRRRGYGAIVLYGCVRDKRLADIVRDFKQACDEDAFVPGPVPIPTEVD